MNAPFPQVRLRDRDEHLIDVRLACERIGVLGSESQPDCSEIARTAEGLRRLLSEPIAEGYGDGL